MNASKQYPTRDLENRTYNPESEDCEPVFFRKKTGFAGFSWILRLGAKKRISIYPALPPPCISLVTVIA